MDIQGYGHPHRLGLRQPTRLPTASEIKYRKFLDEIKAVAQNSLSITSLQQPEAKDELSSACYYLKNLGRLLKVGEISHEGYELEVALCLGEVKAKLLSTKESSYAYDFLSLCFTGIHAWTFENISDAVVECGRALLEVILTDNDRSMGPEKFWNEILCVLYFLSIDKDLALGLIFSEEEISQWKACATLKDIEKFSEGLPLRKARLACMLKEVELLLTQPLDLEGFHERKRHLEASSVASGTKAFAMKNSLFPILRKVLGRVAKPSKDPELIRSLDEEAGFPMLTSMEVDLAFYDAVRLIRFLVSSDPTKIIALLNNVFSCSGSREAKYYFLFNYTQILKKEMRHVRNALACLSYMKRRNLFLPMVECLIQASKENFGENESRERGRFLALYLELMALMYFWIFPEKDHREANLSTLKEVRMLFQEFVMPSKEEVAEDLYLTEAMDFLQKTLLSIIDHPVARARKDRLNKLYIEQMISECWEKYFKFVYGQEVHDEVRRIFLKLSPYGNA